MSGKKNSKYGLGQSKYYVLIQRHPAEDDRNAVLHKTGFTHHSPDAHCMATANQEPHSAAGTQ